jgi:hypothetical protein
MHVHEHARRNAYSGVADDGEVTHDAQGIFTKSTTAPQ